MLVKDDRGNRVPLLPPRQLSAAPLSGGPLPLEARRELQPMLKQVRSSSKVNVASLVCVIVMIPYIIGVRFFFLAYLEHVAWANKHWYVAAFVPVPVLWWWITRSGRELTARAIVRLGHCASCGYSLRTLTPDRDLRTVCPECGSAWRIPPLKEA
jgi:hypothetical protein